MHLPLTSRNRVWWIVACIVVVSIYAITIPLTWQCEGVDEIEYLGLAHSLESGLGYTLYEEPYGYYPPLYPAVLSLLMRMDVQAWRGMYLLNALLGAAALVVSGTYVRRRFGLAGIWGSFFLVCSYYAWSFSTRYIMSEPMYLLWSMVALVCAWEILSKNTRKLSLYILLAACVLLAAMTRSGALALTASLFVAGGLRWIMSRRAAGFWVALVVLLFAGTFFVAWEYRAQLVAPHASESYLRWAWRFLGMTQETEGMIAQGTGEGVTEATQSLSGRALALSAMMGQVLASVVRVPPAFRAPALILFVIILSGWLRHMVCYPWSPLGWYFCISFAMFSMTLWISSYTRYLYLLLPLLFLFCALGFVAWKDLLGSRFSHWAGGIMAVVGCVACWWCFSHLGAKGMSGGEAVYMQLISGLSLLLSMALAVMGIWWFVRGKRISSLHWAQPLLFLVLCAYILHAGFLLAKRYRLTRRNTTLMSRNLGGVTACGEWIEKNTSENQVLISSFPRLCAFLADRRSMPPRYVGGELVITNVDFVILTGELDKVPAFRPGEEEGLKQSVERLQAEGKVVPVFLEGHAAVFKVLEFHSAEAR